MIIEDVVEKAAYARPGFTLAAFKQAALPVFVITARVITLEKKPISPIEEGCIRAVEAGLSNPDDISAFLGLSRQVLKGTLATLNSREQINYFRPVASASAKVEITEKGRMVLTQSKIIVPEERLVPFVFDPLLKKVVFVSMTGLSRPKEVKELGWLEIPLCGLKRPEVDDIPLSDIDKAVQGLSRRPDEMRELLAVRRIERRELRFASALVLFYRSHSAQEVQVAFHREGGESIEHETAFAALGGPALIGAQHVLRPPEIPQLNDVGLAEQVAAKQEEVDSIEKVIAAAESPPTETTTNIKGVGPTEDAKSLAEDARARLKAMTQRPVRCHEHPRLLRDALTKTQERLLIISPWINHHVVDDMFIRSLEALLRNGVDVYIVYGLADEDGAKGNDKAKQKPAISFQAQEELDGIRKRFDNFTLKFVGNTHRKMLVSDSRFAVVTSFNWLSFKGDPKSKARDELGILISEPEMLEKLFKDGMALMSEGYDHPKSGVGVDAKHAASQRSGARK